ncbi:hypothetical protein SAMN03159496_04791, partial [Rhizobium sp. NFR07]
TRQGLDLVRENPPTTFLFLPYSIVKKQTLNSLIKKTETSKPQETNR